tara:strand:+ start:42504 stop:42818 length:315 start_codon:yes stop_codon:yes gene_type:complete
MDQKKCPNKTPANKIAVRKVLDFIKETLKPIATMIRVKPNIIKTGYMPFDILKAILEVPKNRWPAIAPKAKGIKKDLPFDHPNSNILEVSLSTSLSSRRISMIK